MAADSEERGQELQERNDSTTNSAEMQRLPEEVCKQTLDDWRDSAAEYVRAELFDKKQFITDEEIGMGGSIQKLVCAYINISGSERARSFWEEQGGKETVRKTFRRKRQAAQNAMKLAFRGKYQLRRQHSSQKSSSSLKHTPLLRRDGLMDWIIETTKGNKPDPPAPGEIEASMRKNRLHYAEFTDRMIRAVHGKSQYGEKAVHMLFGSLVSPSQEAFTMLLYRNGYQKWVWMHNGSVSSEASEGSNGDTSDGFPGYVYTARSSDLTSRNGGWSRPGMLKYNDLYKQVKKDRLEDNGAYDREYIAHCVEKSKNKRKRRRDNGGQLRSLIVSDDIGDL
jgi:hypothetical protein